MTGVNDEHAAKTKPSFRKKVLISLISFFLVVIGWLFWQIYAFNNAILVAKEAGFKWYCENPIRLIRQDWRYALEKETWGQNDRELEMKEVSDLDRYREMLHQLRLTALVLSDCYELQNVDALEDLTTLRILIIENCTALQNVDGLKNLAVLRYLNLNGCIELQNIDVLKNLTALAELELRGCNKLQNVYGLKGLTGLINLDLSGCNLLQNVDDLKGLTGLEELYLNGCSNLKNVGGLKSLTALESLDLSGCDKIPAAALRELHVALPKTNIVFPDGAPVPPE